MIRSITCTWLLVALVACGSPPTDARRDLDPRWVTPEGKYWWPPTGAGFSGVPTYATLSVGTLLDRFKDMPMDDRDAGTIFFLKGTRFDGRSLPIQCQAANYQVFEVKKQFGVWNGRTAPWFDMPGGATRLRSDAALDMLIRDHLIEQVPYAAGTWAEICVYPEYKPPLP